MAVNRVRMLVALASVTMLSSCHSSDPGTNDSTIMVFAAASLKAPFTALGAEFSKANRGATVEFSFAGSSSLVTQLTQGDHADVFASADTANMDKAAQAGLLGGQPVNFASNTLTIAVAPGNPKRITDLRDLDNEDISVVVCASQVPCGAATDKVEKAAGITLTPVSEETSVTDVLNKVTSGQADAGLVYVTDAMGAGDKVTSVPFSESAGAVNTYPISALKQSNHSDLARSFIELVMSPAGQKELANAGFGKP